MYNPWIRLDIIILNKVKKWSQDRVCRVRERKSEGKLVGHFPRINQPAARMERARTFHTISLRGHKLVQVFRFAHANIFPCLPATPLYLSRLLGCFSPKGVPNSSWHRVNGRIASSFSRNAHPCGILTKVTFGSSSFHGDSREHWRSFTLLTRLLFFLGSFFFVTCVCVFWLQSRNTK